MLLVAKYQMMGASKDLVLLAEKITDLIGVLNAENQTYNIDKEVQKFLPEAATDLGWEIHLANWALNDNVTFYFVKL